MFLSEILAFFAPSYFMGACSLLMADLDAELQGPWTSGFRCQAMGISVTSEP